MEMRRREIPPPDNRPALYIHDDLPPEIPASKITDSRGSKTRGVVDDLNDETAVDFDVNHQDDEE